MANIANAEITEIRQADGSFASAAVKPIGAGILLLAAAAVIAFMFESVGTNRFWHAYLLGVTYCTSLGLGGLFFVLAHHLTGGRWGTPIRRLAELTAGTLWVSAILFIPILLTLFFGNPDLYPWADRGIFVGDSILSGKIDYLSPKWFAIRTIVYFVLWIWMSRTMLSISVKQDTDNPLGRARRMQALCGPMMVLYAMTMNFAAFDWLMSLEPHWFSTMFGVYFFAGSFEGFMALAIFLSFYLQGKNILSQSITTEQYHDMAKLMFAFIVFWAYIAFSQFLLIWYAAIPEETLWYDLRWERGWLWWGALLLFGHLFIPFLGTMSRAIRRNKKFISAWAVWMLFMHWVDLVYIIMPQAKLLSEPSESGAMLIPWFELIVTAGVLGIFIGVWLFSAAGKYLLPVQDPRMPIALTYHNH